MTRAARAFHHAQDGTSRERRAGVQADPTRVGEIRGAVLEARQQPGIERRDGIARKRPRRHLHRMCINEHAEHGCGNLARWSDQWKLREPSR